MSQTTEAPHRTLTRSVMVTNGTHADLKDIQNRMARDVSRRVTMEEVIRMLIETLETT